MFRTQKRRFRLIFQVVSNNIFLLSHSNFTFLALRSTKCEKHEAVRQPIRRYRYATSVKYHRLPNLKSKFQTTFLCTNFFHLFDIYS